MERATVAIVSGNAAWVTLARAPGQQFGPCEIYTDQAIAPGSRVIVGRIDRGSDDLVVLGVLRTA